MELVWDVAGLIYMCHGASASALPDWGESETRRKAS